MFLFEIPEILNVEPCSTNRVPATIVWPHDQKPKKRLQGRSCWL